METTTYQIYSTIAQLPKKWDEVAHENAFLQTSYLKVLEESAPINMQCFYVGIFEKNSLIGVALAQYLDLNKLESFGERDQCIKTFIRNFIFKN
ncbi:MAG: 8-amino-7-oxononanoate synthase, partial [Flavobacterium sp.]